MSRRRNTTRTSPLVAVTDDRGQVAALDGYVPLNPESRAPGPGAAVLRSPLVQLRVLCQLRADLEVELDAMVAAAVAAGHSYGEVGQALGVTRQAARQRHQRG